MRNTTNMRDRGKLRVAAYIRVSTDLKDQENSFETQERYFSDLLMNNPEWVSAGIYSDYGISGTSGRKRTGFQRILRHCKEGKIDRIVTKSISRFARNTADFMMALDILQESNVSIVFEKEGLDTCDAFSSFILTTLAAIAQEESRSISSNMNLGNHMRFPRGEVPNKEIYGYRFTNRYTVMESGYRYRTVEIVEEEAEVVRWIFESYINGMTFRELARDLNRRQVPHKISAYTKKRMQISEKGQLNAELDDGWTVQTVGDIVKNERYAGDVLVQKTYTKDYLTHKTVRNRGEMPRYYVKDHHPAIISREIYETAEKLREFSAVFFGYHRKPGNDRVFSRRLICGGCGRYYNVRNTSCNPIWFCPTTTRNNGKVNCRNEKVYEAQIVRMLRKAIAERFRLMSMPVIDNSLVTDIMGGCFGEKDDQAIIFSAGTAGFVEQMLARLTNLQQTDFMERDRAFLKRQIVTAGATLDSCRKRVPLVEEELKLAEAAFIKAKEKLEYMEKYWDELETDYDQREKAIEWMEGLPGGEKGVAELLNGMTGAYATAFVLSITVHSPFYYTVHWFDDTRTDVEMYSNVEDHRYTAACFDVRARGENNYRGRRA